MSEKPKEKEIKESDSKLKLYLSVSLPIFGILIVGIIFESPDIYKILTGSTIFVPHISDLTYSEKLNFIFAFALVEFAALEGYSTYTQVVMDQRRNTIESAKDELEKAYGPLYSILNYPVKVEEKTVKVASQDFKNIDRIISVYPWMFPEKIRDLWNKTRSPMLTSSETYPTGRTLSVNETGAGLVALYDVSFEFRNMINEEYHQRVQRYNRLLGKNREGSS